MMRKTGWIFWVVCGVLLGTAACGEDDFTAGVKLCSAYMCEADADCNAAVYKGGCDTARKMCVQCKKDADCDPKLYKGCATALGICASCKVDADCQQGGKPLRTGKCDANTGDCRGCSTDADCKPLAAGGYKVCGAKRFCVECTTDKDCGTGKECKNESCTTASPCTKDTDCKAPLTCTQKQCACSVSTDCKTAYGTPAGFKGWVCK